eukprot:366473-Chlamydomonas_euryale.AAC.1
MARGPWRGRGGGNALRRGRGARAVAAADHVVRMSLAGSLEEGARMSLAGSLGEGARMSLAGFGDEEGSTGAQSGWSA